jgi:hypothetical protein
MTASLRGLPACNTEACGLSHRFPNAMCSDRGRRINNSEPDWETTLESRPKFVYEFWHDHLRPLGFHLKAEVLEYPGACPAISVISSSKKTWPMRIN